MSGKGRQPKHLDTAAKSGGVSGEAPHPHGRPCSDSADARHQELLQAIVDLGARIERRVAALSPVAPIVCGPTATAPGEAERVRRELGHVLEGIDNVKREIADLRRDHRLLDAVRERASAGGDPYEVLANASDSATAAILTSAERIDDLVTARCDDTSSEDVGTRDEVREHLVRIFEACNVQDFASLRVTRFLMTMRQVEDRLRELCGPLDDAWTTPSQHEPPALVQRLSK